MSLSALYSGASGLEANSQALDVIGNNLANLNTTGYKDQSAQFSDLVYQTMSAGTAPATGTGGTNPNQQGFGVGVGSVATNFTSGDINPTGLSTDAAIQGNGFFVVSNGNSTEFTRAGSFNISANGFLVDPNTGYLVQRTGTVGEPTGTSPGFQVAGNNNIQVPIGAGLPGTQTSNVMFQGNIDSGTAVGGAVNAGSIQVFDSQGTARTLNVTFTNTGSNTYSVSASVNGGTATIPAGTTVTFDSNGILQSPASIPLTVTGLPNAGTQTINLNLGTVGEATGLTQFGGSSTASAITQNGVAPGTLQSISYDQNGDVLGQFSNGQTVAIAQLAVANFNNESGLVRQGNNYYSQSAASGQALIGTAGSNGAGTVAGGSLEGSNVDISTEFSQLIIAQRGFQINAQTLTAANDALQTIANIIH